MITRVLAWADDHTIAAAGVIFISGIVMAFGIGIGANLAFILWRLGDRAFSACV